MKIIITGAAGFIGSHAAIHFLKQGAHVVGVDNLSRAGSHLNLDWIRAQGGNFQFVHADVRHAEDITNVFSHHSDAQAVIHLAAQVAVTTSVTNPRTDFEINARGTLNLLEAARQYCPGAPFLYSSTNKVYGGMEHVQIVERDGRYAYQDYPQGIDESAPLDFHSPYGCSKGSADQYVHDYARIYGLKSVVFRQSCIYGTHQYGIEDQGWVAWLTIASVLGKPFTIYGDGKQIRDLLWVDDLIHLYDRAIARIETAAGNVYNAGGGAGNTLSLLELVRMLGAKLGKDLPHAWGGWRPGDQLVFVANTEKARRDLGWAPTVSPEEGVQRILDWTLASRTVLETF